MLNKKLLNYRPFLFSAISIALGIGAGYAFYFENVLWGVLLSVIFVLFLLVTILLTGVEIKSKLVFALAFILIFIFGAGAFCYQLSDYDNANLESHYYMVTGKVTEVSETEYGQRLIVEDVIIEGDRKGECRYNVALYLNGESQCDIGDLISFSAYLNDNGAEYEGRLSATNVERGVKYNASLESVEDLTILQSSPNLFEKIHIFLRDAVRVGMDEQEAAVAYGMLLGNTDDMDHNVIYSYRSAGVAHIFAVSGLHIGFLAAALNLLFNKCKLNKLVKAIVITLTLFFYSGVCGFTASSVRASVMTSVLLFSSVKGNRYDGLSSVGLAFTLILLSSPINMFCVGFQLSFVVVFGMLLLSSPLSKLFSFLPKKFADSLGAVISAQLMGIPICLYAFNQFSTIAILANLILIPIISVIFVILLLATILGGAIGIEGITLFVPNYIFKGINYAITAIDYQLFIVGGITLGIFVVFYYLAVIIPSGLLNVNKILKAVLTLLCVIVCVVGTTLTTINDRLATKVYVMGEDRAGITVIKSQHESVMIVSQVNGNFSVNRLRRISEREKIGEIDTLIIAQNQTDIQVVLTRLNQVFNFGEVCYFGSSNTTTEEVIRKSFGIGARAFNEGERLTDYIDCKYALNGYAVECSINGKAVAILSEFGKDYSGYVGLGEYYDYVIATDYLEQVYSEYKPEQFISYKNSVAFADAQSGGTITLTFD